jgi:signal transduction histidine kinase
LSSELARIAGQPGSRVEFEWPDGVTVPAAIEPLAQSVLAESLRNVAKHAVASTVWVAVSSDSDTFTLEIRNDGVRPGARGTGMGLRLAAFEALRHGGMVEFGAPQPGLWRVRLVVPLAEVRSP